MTDNQKEMVRILHISKGLELELSVQIPILFSKDEEKYIQQYL